MTDISLPAGLAVVLVLAGLWNLVVWPRFLQRVAADPRARKADGRRTRFFTVHAVLVTVSLILGVAVAAVGLLALMS